MELQQALEKFAAATNNELFDADPRFNEWMVSSVETHETIDDFVAATAGYNSCTNDKFGEIAGFKFVAYSEIQVRKGDTRRKLSVVDFGGVRYAIDADLTDF